jgi:hypothetical protein
VILAAIWSADAIVPSIPFYPGLYPLQDLCRQKIIRTDNARPPNQILSLYCQQKLSVEISIIVAMLLKVELHFMETRHSLEVKLVSLCYQKYDALSDI